MDLKGIVFFDYDGTLADESENIYFPTDCTKAALSKLQENGYKIVLATGRAKRYLPDAQINFDGYCLSNGAYAEINNTAVCEIFMDEEKILPLISEFEKRGLGYSVENQNGCYASDIKNETFLSMLENFNIPRDAFYQLDKSNLPKASKLLLSYENERNFEELQAMFCDYFVFDKHRKFKSCDISRKGVTKGTAAQAIVDFLKLSNDNVYAFGDATNDYDMLKVAGHGIAMGYHAEKLKEVAQMITDTVKNEGIYKALKEYNLI